MIELELTDGRSLITNNTTLDGLLKRFQKWVSYNYSVSYMESLAIFYHYEANHVYVLCLFGNSDNINNFANWGYRKLEGVEFPIFDEDL